MLLIDSKNKKCRFVKTDVRYGTDITMHAFVLNTLRITIMREADVRALRCVCVYTITCFIAFTDEAQMCV